MQILFLLAFLILCVVALVFAIKHKIFIDNILWNFKHCNVIVAGKKGTGKDILFNFVVNKRKERYYGNVCYTENNNKIPFEKISISDVSVAPNTIVNFVNNKIEAVPRRFYEKRDIYISDIGNFLPSYLDSTLYKLFPSMPMYYSLSRHLAEHNIHCNTQNIERGWKALREQADFYIICKRTFKLFGFIFITKCITYDKYESARQGLLPLKTRFFNKYSKAEVDKYYAVNGEIKTGHIIQFKNQLHYDTRAFEKLLLSGERLTDKRKKRG